MIYIKINKLLDCNSITNQSNNPSHSILKILQIVFMYNNAWMIMLSCFGPKNQMVLLLDIQYMGSNRNMKNISFHIKQHKMLLQHCEQYT